MSRKRVVAYIAERFDRELAGFSVGILHLKICDGRHREGQPESSGSENGPVVTRRIRISDKVHAHGMN